MQSIKSFTDLEQSKKLAKILPIESADMFYGTIAPYDYSDRMYDGGVEDIPLPKSAKSSSVLSADEYDGEIPAWSLAALLGILPPKIVYEATDYFLEVDKNPDESYDVVYRWKYSSLLACNSESLVDACVDMIIRLNELNLL